MKVLVTELPQVSEECIFSKMDHDHLSCILSGDECSLCTGKECDKLADMSQYGTIDQIQDGLILQRKIEKLY